MSLLVAFAACVIYGRTRDGISFVKVQSAIIFLLEICNMYRMVMTFYDSESLLFDSALAILRFGYFFTSALSYWNVAFKYWTSSKLGILEITELPWDSS